MKAQQLTKPALTKLMHTTRVCLSCLLGESDASLTPPLEPPLGTYNTSWVF
jgi:hypothetical protein